MQTKAHDRAQACRARAEECLALGNDAVEPSVKHHYYEIAQCYLTLAKTEDEFAAELERLAAASDRKH